MHKIAVGLYIKIILFPAFHALRHFVIIIDIQISNFQKLNNLKTQLVDIQSNWVDLKTRCSHLKDSEQALNI